MQGRTARQFVAAESGRIKLTQLHPNGNERILWIAAADNPVGANTGYREREAMPALRSPNLDPKRTQQWREME